METVFMNTENSMTNKPHRLRLTLADWSIYYTWKNIEQQTSPYNNKFKISAPTWNDEFNLPDGSYSILDIQDYF